MASIGHRHPPPKSTSSSISSCGYEFASALALNPKPFPPYGSRSGFVPRKPEDFGDGGAFPEIHVAQFPLGTGGAQNPASKILPLTVDSHGKLAFDTIVKQEPNPTKIVYSEHKHLVPKVATEEIEEEDPASTARRTKEALHKILNAKALSSASQFIKYKPSSSSEQERIVRIIEKPNDPLEPPKFRHKRIPKAPGSPPVPILHSPPRPVTVEDQRDWKVPPCISDCKNPKGYTIGLDKRAAADGSGLHEVMISDKFSRLSEVMYLAERRAREEVAIRSKVQRELVMKEKDRREQELCALAREARSQRAHVESHEGVMERVEREKLLEERRRERRLEARDAAMGKKSRVTRDGERDIGEKVALGMAHTGDRTGEVMYDQRLFNQHQGMQSGFVADDQYNVYDRGLFTARSTLSTLYAPRREMADSDVYGEKQEKTLEARDRPLAGQKPVEFNAEEEEDVFDLGRFATATMGKRETWQRSTSSEDHDHA